VLCVLSWGTLGPGFVSDLRPPRDKILDFFQEWASARNFRSGLPIYTNQGQTMDLYLGVRLPYRSFGIHFNAHPPPSVLLVLPLAWLDYPDAFLVWSLLSLAALAVSGWLIVRHLGLPFSAWSLLPAVTLALVCNPFRQQMIQGQLNLVLLLLLVGLWAAERSDRAAWAGVCLGLAAAIKLFPALFFVYYLLRRRWAVLAWGAGTLALATALTAAVLGPSAYQGYVRDALPAVALFYGWWPNISLTGFWFKLFDGGSGHVIPLWHSPLLARAATLVSWVVVLALLAAAALRARTRHQRDLAFGLTVIALVLLSPIAWDHYCVLLLLPVVLLWLELPRHGLRRQAFRVCLVVLWLTPMVYWHPLIGAHIETWLAMVAAPWQTLTALSFPFYALLGLFVLGCSTVKGGGRGPRRAAVDGAGGSAGASPSREASPSRPALLGNRV
jgi:hypothetical protein